MVVSNHLKELSLSNNLSLPQTTHCTDGSARATRASSMQPSWWFYTLEMFRWIPTTWWFWKAGNSFQIWISWVSNVSICRISMSKFRSVSVHILFVVDPWPCNKTTKYNESQCNLTRVSTGGKYTLKRWIMFAILVYPKVPCKKKHLSETFTHVLQFTRSSFFWRVTPFFSRVIGSAYRNVAHGSMTCVGYWREKILQFRWILEPVIQDLGAKTGVCFMLFWLNKVHLDLIWIFQTALMYTSFFLHSTLVYFQLTCYNRLPTLTAETPYLLKGSTLSDFLWPRDVELTSMGI